MLVALMISCISLQKAWWQRETSPRSLLHREPPGMLQPLFKGEDLGLREGRQGPGGHRKHLNFQYFYNLTLHSSFLLPPPPFMVASILLSLDQEITVDAGQGSETG